MSDAQRLLEEAAREVEMRVYRDCPQSNHRHTKADRAVAQVLEVVCRAIGLRDGTRITLRKDDSPLIEDAPR